MWREASRCIINAGHTIQTFHQSHNQFIRNTGLLFIIAGTAVGMLVFLTTMLFTGNLERFTESDTMVIDIIVVDSLSAGFNSLILAGGLVAIHLHNDHLPANGLAFTSRIPAEAWKLFGAGFAIMLLLFAFFKGTQALAIYGGAEQPALTTNIYTWLEHSFYVLMQVTAAVFAVLIFMRGIGQRLSLESRPAVAASVILLFCWIQTLQGIVYCINNVIVSPISLLFPESDIYTYLQSISYITVFVFGLLPAAALASSLWNRVTEIQFDAETANQD